MPKNRKLLLLGVTLVIAGFFIVVFAVDWEEEDMYEAPLAVDGFRSFEDPANYKFKEKKGVILVENNNLGFSFEFPNDWDYEKYYESYGLLADEKEKESKGLNLFSPNYYVDKNKKSTASLTKGCSVNIYILEECYENENGIEFCIADGLKETIDMITDGEITTDNEGIIKIDGFKGHRINYINENSKIDHIRIPIGSKVYEITGYFSKEDIEECQQNYENILDSISFTKNE
ncbi:MAG: hypothetical protein U9P61_02920 [Patescibacteria group bacterium]|nr:hypothetical protein [Patescibacteria group bacterium]